MQSSFALLFLDALPPKTTRGTIVRLLKQVAGIPKERIGRIDVTGRNATVEVPTRMLDSAVSRLDGTSLGDQHIRAWHQSKVSPTGEDERHFDRLSRLLDLEAEAEAEQIVERLRRLPDSDAEKTGISLLDLVVTDTDSGLGGRLLISLRKRNATERLPWTRLNVGTPVLLTNRTDQRQRGQRGIICSKSSRSVQVAFDGSVEFDGDAVFRLDLGHDVVARRRQQAALDRASGAQGDRLAQLCRVLVQGKEPVFGPPEVEDIGAHLNDSQREAVTFAMSARDLAVIHGPPGTGKTTTVVELIRQAVWAGESVLACAPSNLAVDNLLERLLAAKVRAVRIGHPARVLPALREQTLDLLVQADPDVRLARKFVRDAYALRDKASRYTRAKPEPGARRQMRNEARALLADAARIEKQVVQQILDQAEVLCSTTTAINSELLGQRRFDLAVIDEACQSTEPGCWIPLLRSERVVLAGDHCQLPPTVVSPAAAREGFGKSLQQRLLDLHGQHIARRLDIQYRMHSDIMDFSSQQFYDGTLQADESVAEHTLAELATDATATLNRPLYFVDTAGAGYDEQREEDGDSLLNPAEAKVVSRLAGRLVEWGVAPTSIGVISPYAAQVRLLRTMVSSADTEVDTVDGFQGREKEAIIISLVRSNTNSDVGFLRDIRRMNVALTRARRLLIVVGDSATIGGHSFYETMLNYFEIRGVYTTVWDDSIFD